MKNNEENPIKTISFSAPQSILRSIWLFWALFLVTALTIVIHVQPVQALSSVGYVIFYIPGDEEDIMDALQDIPNSGVNMSWTGANINSRVDIISSGNDINVFLDEWEDGYDLLLSNPFSTADAKWDIATGGPGEQGDQLDYGEVLSLMETDTFCAGSQGVDAGDMFYITGGPVNAVRTIWPDIYDPVTGIPGTYIAGSWELYPTVALQSAYTVPVGADTQLPSAGDFPFEFAYLFVQAVQDNTHIIIEDPYTLTSPDVDTVLNKGENLMYPDSADLGPPGNGDITCHQGTTVIATDNTSSEPVNVQTFISTSTNQTYDFRYYTLTPEEYLGDKYVIPVPSMNMDLSEANSLGRNWVTLVETAMYVYSFQDNTDVWVETASGSTQLDPDLDTGEVLRYVMPMVDTDAGYFEGDYGARIFINNPNTGDKIWILGAGDDAYPNLDWGFQALNPDYLADNYFLPWAPSNPTYITPVDDNTIFNVDWDLDGVSDQTFTLHRLQMKMLYPPSTANPNSGETYDGTGAHIWANRPFHIVWGQDYTEHTTGPEADNYPPDYDWGHTILPLYWYDSVLGIDKSANPILLTSVEADSDEPVTFTLVVATGDYEIDNTEVSDILPPGWSYVDDSTSITLSYVGGGTTYSGASYDPAISDSTLTWDLHGLGLNDTMPANQTITLTFGAAPSGSYVCGGNINTGRAYGTDANGNAFRPQDTATVDILCLSITKTSDTGGQPVQPNDAITYTIEITNNSDTSQTGITVTDPLPAYTDYVAQSTQVVGWQAPAITETVRDEFTSQSYSNNDGSENWAAAWDEVNDGFDSPTAGQIQIAMGGELRFQLISNQYIERRVDLSGQTIALLTFDWRTISLEENIAVRISSDGSTFTTLDTFTGYFANGSVTYDITAYISANTTVRIENTGSNWNEWNDYAYFDNIQIEYSDIDIDTVRDEFTTTAYSNNDGTENWAAAWDETNDDDSPSSGQIYITSGEMMFWRIADEYIERSVDLSGQSIAILTFDWRTSSLEETIAVRISSNGSSFTTLDTFTGFSASGSECYDITGYISANTTIRIENTGLAWSGWGNDYAYFDNIQIAYGSGGGTAVAVTKDNIPGGTCSDLTDGDPPNLTVAGDGFILEPDASMTITFEVTVESYTPSYITEIQNEACVTTNQFSNQLCDSVIDTPTLAVLTSFDAYTRGGHVTVEWQTASEIGTAGFYLYRLDTGTREFRQINSQILPGLLHAPQGGVYRYVDEGADTQGTLTYELVEVEAIGQRHKYGPFTIDLEEKPNARKQARRAVIENGSFGFTSEPHGMTKDEKDRVEKSKEAKAAAKKEKKMKKGNACKIAINQTGLYFLDASHIADRLGISTQSVEKYIKKKQLALSNLGETVAWFPGDENRGIYFYGQRLDSIYSNENIYLLKSDNKNHDLIMEILEGRAPRPVSNTQHFVDSIHVEEDVYPLTALFHNPEADYWVWDYVIAGNPYIGSKTFTLLAHGAADTGTATLIAHLKGNTDTEADLDHHVKVRLNGTQIGEDRWNGIADHDLVMAFDQALLNAGENHVEVAAILDPGVIYSIFYVNSFDLTYERYYQAIDNSLLAWGHGNAVVTIEGFTSNTITLFDLSDPLRPKLVTATTIDASPAGNFRVSFSPETEDTPYLALSNDAVRKCNDVWAVTGSTLYTQKNIRADYMVIAPLETLEAAQELGAYRQAQGLDTMVVDLEEIYDQFSYGIETPHAIRDFLSYAHDTWKRPPIYVVLAGQGTYDYKDNLGYGGNLIPPLMVATPHGLFTSDNQYADIKGDDGLPAMIIGRLPVVSSNELEALVQKIVAYESAPGGGWPSRVLMLADDPDGPMNFPADSNDVAVIVSRGYSVDKVYLSEHSIYDARQMVLDGINSGALLVNYIGHAGLDRLAQEGMLLKSDVPGLTNDSKLPVFSAMTCVVGRFAIPGFSSLSKDLVLKPDGGVIAAWAPTGLSNNSQAKILDEALFNAVFVGREKVLGDAVMSALQGYAIRGSVPHLLDIFTLLGDPALQIK